MKLNLSNILTLLRILVIPIIVAFIYLKDKDVVRHELVRKIINAYGNFK